MRFLVTGVSRSGPSPLTWWDTIPAILLLCQGPWVGHTFSCMATVSFCTSWYGISWQQPPVSYSLLSLTLDSLLRDSVWFGKLPLPQCSVLFWMLCRELLLVWLSVRLLWTTGQSSWEPHCFHLPFLFCSCCSNPLNFLLWNKDEYRDSPIANNLPHLFSLFHSVNKYTHTHAQCVCICMYVACIYPGPFEA